MIDEIHISSNVATYQAPTKLDDLRCINYIFGANGTGKTTISRVIDQVEGYSHCSLNWSGETPLEAMVYNRDFVDRNFNDENNVQGVFTLGDNQVEAEREIAALQPEIEQLKGKVKGLKKQLDGEYGQSGKRKELHALAPQLSAVCWKQKKLHDSHFQTAFTGVRNSAERFKTKVLVEQGSNTADLLQLNELKEKAATIFSSSLEKVSPLAELSVAILVESESNDLLQKVIVGNQEVDIAAMIAHVGNSDWVKSGLPYHQQQPTVCPFCQQPTSDQFSKSLEDFFSEAYDNDIEALKLLVSKYTTAKEQANIKIEANISSLNSFLNKELFEAEAQAFNERLLRNLALLEGKIAEPSQKVVLQPIAPLIEKLQEIIAETNIASMAHNKTVTNIAVEKETLTSQVWRYVLNELSSDLTQYNQQKDRLARAISGLEGSLDAKQQSLRKLQKKVQELEKQTTSIHPTKDAINNLLKTFGFHSFHIDVVDEQGHYKICRENGDDASSSLSEGEKTFITFLYFYSLIKGAHASSGTTSSRIVVFDDPVSSLDSDILYIVSSLIKAVMEEARTQVGYIKQVFILTHNVYFHKEISFHRRRCQSNVMSDESFWMVKKQHNGSVVLRCDKNPIRSAYELLWEDVKSANSSSISLQNTLRRILENYFTMWGGKSKDEICDLFEGRDKLTCQSLFSWVNDGSHSIHDDLYINHGEQTNESYLQVFKDIFVKADQAGHYNMMVGVIS